VPDVKHFDQDAVLETVLLLFWQRGPAATGVQDIVEATGLNRSSLYATFGDKQALFQAALTRYVDERSTPAFDRLGGEGRGLDAVRDFFNGLIDARCEGPFARWGCMVANTYAAPELLDSKVREVMERHHTRLVGELRAALETAAGRGQLQQGIDLRAGAEHLALLAYGINIRSRDGAHAEDLRAGIAAALALMAA
jgi:AcrR family transcriptional regulator